MTHVFPRVPPLQPTLRRTRRCSKPRARYLREIPDDPDGAGRRRAVRDRAVDAGAGPEPGWGMRMGGPTGPATRASTGAETPRRCRRPALRTTQRAYSMNMLPRFSRRARRRASPDSGLSPERPVLLRLAQAQAMVQDTERPAVCKPPPNIAGAARTAIPRTAGGIAPPTPHGRRRRRTGCGGRPWGRSDNRSGAASWPVPAGSISGRRPGRSRSGSRRAAASWRRPPG
jgi:hypothetical protein